MKLIALSCDEVDSHKKWCLDIVDGEFGFPIISDPTKKICIELGMLDPEELGTDGREHRALLDPSTAPPEPVEV